MKKIVTLFIAVVSIITIALGWRVIHTTTMMGISEMSFTVEGDSRHIWCNGDTAAIVINDILSREPELMVDSEYRVYENGDTLTWNVDPETQDRVFRYHIGNGATLFPNQEFKFTMKGAGACPLESL